MALVREDSSLWNALGGVCSASVSIESCVGGGATVREGAKSVCRPPQNFEKLNILLDPGPHGRELYSNIQLPLILKSIGVIQFMDQVNMR